MEQSTRKDEDPIQYRARQGQQLAQGATRRSIALWRFVLCGFAMLALCSIDLFYQVQFLSITTAPQHMRSEHLVQSSQSAPPPRSSAQQRQAVDLLDDDILRPGNPYPSYVCKGWRQTGGCDPDGKREPGNDLGCNAAISGGLSGYCEFFNPVQNETVHLMKMSCGSLRKHVSFSCNMTADTIMFHQYAAVYRHPWNMQGTPESRNFIDSNSFTGLDFHATTPRKYPDRAWYDQETTESSAVTRQTSRGIVMVVYGKALVPLYATVQYLRHDLASTLPIEIWYRSDEVNPHNNSVLAAIANLPHVHMREILDPLAQGFYVKPYVIFFSQFRQVLFLDADNLPLHDPAFLFDTPEFKRDGAIFWPDFWHPENTIFNVHRGSFVWTLLNHPFVDMFEQESGQLVIDRARCERALHLLMFYAFHRIRPQEPIEYSMLDDGPVLPVDPNLIAALALVWGDKDLFRLAWLKTNTSFYMVERPPGALGVYGRPPMKGDRGGFTPEDDETLPVRFCGKAMVQYNMGNQSQEPLFLHRNTVKLSQTNTTRVKQWFAFQELRPSIAKYQDVKDKYVIQAWAERTSCFGEHLGATEAFSLADTNGTIFEAAEAQLLKYADQAAAMLPPEKTPPPAKKRAIAPTVARSHPIKSPAAEPDLKDLMLG